jgi:hypothetical protein
MILMSKDRHQWAMHASTSKSLLEVLVTASCAGGLKEEVFCLGGGSPGVPSVKCSIILAEVLMITLEMQQG